MKHVKYIIILFGSLLINFNKLDAQKIQYSFEKTISLQGDDGYDYLFIDQEKRNLYVSHGTSVHVISLDSEKLIGTIKGTKGNHGIAIVQKSNLGFISDGKSNEVSVFDLTTLEVKTTIKLNGEKPDAIIYDVFSNKVLAFNGSSNNASVIDINTLKEIATIDLGGAPEFAVSDGLGKVYCNLEDKNSIKVIDIKSFKIVNTIPLAPCGAPTGLTMDIPNQLLFTVCRENKGMSVVDVRSGKVLNTFPIGSGVDAVAYDIKLKIIFCSNGDGTTSIYMQNGPNNYTLIQTLATQVRAKTLALDQKTHKIYLSVADFDPITKKALPDTFRVLVYKMSN